ncbi:hypothetical protein [Cysteiniphilum marinum]|uniref:hypothetical protein n=1 Tax=Cysteiniphilum marinum TaxID=2774191 RepID=UPI00193C55DF|nr:hypothetical protein [Cysteiniphilum marinum]
MELENLTSGLIGALLVGVFVPLVKHGIERRFINGQKRKIKEYFIKGLEDKEHPSRKLDRTHFTVHEDEIASDLSINPINVRELLFSMKEIEISKSKQIVNGSYVYWVVTNDFFKALGK